MSRTSRRFFLHVVSASAVVVGAFGAALIVRKLLGFQVSDLTICALAILFAAIINAVLFSRWG